MKSSFSVSIIIPNYNGVGLLKKNLPFVVKAKNNEKYIKEIIIVDDFSTDRSIEYITKYYPDIKIVKHKKHRGFSAAVNTGARSSMGKLIVLLNNDVAPSSDFLKYSIPHFTRNNVFAVSFNEGSYSWTKGRFEKGFIVFKSGKKQNIATETFWANGGSAIFKRKFWMQLGGLDEMLYSPFYWEDIDISYRAQKRGWKVLWEPRSKVDHEHESTTGKYPKKYRQRIQERNQLLFIWKNLSSPNLFKKHIFGLTQRIIKHPGYLLIFLLAFTKTGLVLSSRKTERKQCKVSDEAIFEKYA